MLVYDISKSESFNNVPNWLGALRQHSPADSVLMLVGNKDDRNHLREVPTEKAGAFAGRSTSTTEPIRDEMLIAPLFNS